MPNPSKPQPPKAKAKRPRKKRKQKLKPRARKPPGRPPGISEEQRAQLESIISEGNSNAKSCEAVGIPIATFTKWMSRGAIEGDTEEERTTSDGEVIPMRNLLMYREFRAGIIRARAIGQMTLVRTIKAQAPNDWRAAAWILERVNPEDFSVKNKIDINHTGEINQTIITEDRRKELIQKKKDSIARRMRK